MDKRKSAGVTPERHNCQDHIRYDGGQKINRNGVRIWIETYYCRICGTVLERREEILD